MNHAQPDDPSACDGRRARGDKARAQVLAHCTQIASTDGLDGLTIGRVAAEAGVAKGNIQVLFRDKESLQLATIDAAVELYRAQVVQPALRHARPLARLRAVVDGWYEFVAQRSLPGGCFLNAVSSEYRARPGLVRDRITAHRADMRERLRALVRAAKDSGELPATLDETQTVFQLVAYQAVANVAALLGDEKEFALARRMARALIAPARPKDGRGG